MKRVFLADSYPDERSALRLLLRDLKLELVGEAADWTTAIAQAPATLPDMILVDSDIIMLGSDHHLSDLRQVCPSPVFIVLISHLAAREQAALSSGADEFISKGETSEQVVERLRAVIEGNLL